jgi:mannose-6-phosphate isomerase-like protein (cupin superfamily)
LPTAKSKSLATGQDGPARFAPVGDWTTIAPLMPSDNFILSLADGELGGPQSDFVIVEWTDSGETGWDWIAPLHVHHADDEAWYVLEGMLQFRIGEQIYQAGPGSAAVAPKGTPHTFGNARRGQVARYLLVMTPKIRALVHALHEPGASDFAAIFRAHDSELLG